MLEMVSFVLHLYFSFIIHYKTHLSYAVLTAWGMWRGWGHETHHIPRLEDEKGEFVAPSVIFYWCTNKTHLSCE